jgi:hypothetical protein
MSFQLNSSPPKKPFCLSFLALGSLGDALPLCAVAKALQSSEISVQVITHQSQCAQLKSIINVPFKPVKVEVFVDETSIFVAADEQGGGGR